MSDMSQFAHMFIKEAVNNSNKNPKTHASEEELKYICDLVINVSGPLNAGTISNEIPLVKFLKQKGSKIAGGGFVVNNNFEIAGLKNIYIPGILARGFNPERKTIIKAILENSNIVMELGAHHEPPRGTLELMCLRARKEYW